MEGSTCGHKDGTFQLLARKMNYRLTEEVRWLKSKKSTRKPKNNSTTTNPNPNHADKRKTILPEAHRVQRESYHVRLALGLAAALC